MTANWNPNVIAVGAAPAATVATMANGKRSDRCRMKHFKKVGSRCVCGNLFAPKSRCRR